jgi:cytochrome c oxidase cbb3-type subunit 3
MNKQRSRLAPAAAVLAFAAAIAGQAQSPEPAFGQISVNQIWADAALREEAQSAGAAVYAGHCASCHGADLKGASGSGAPDLTDEHWLFGGEDMDSLKVQPSDVEANIRFGIRAGKDDLRPASLMPGWQDEKSPSHALSQTEVSDVADYVLSVSGQPHDLQAALRGRALFNGKGACWDCHADDAKGDNSIGVTDLTTPAAWLYGASRDEILASIVMGRSGVSPAFEGKLSDDEIKAVTVFVYGKAAAYGF